MTTVDDLLTQIRRSLDEIAAFKLAASIREIHVTNSATRTIEDWSDVRSPGRAARRRAKHPQRIRVYRMPCIMRAGMFMLVHPEKWEEMVAKVGPLKADPYLPSGTFYYGIPVRFHADV